MTTQPLATENLTDHNDPKLIAYDVLNHHGITPNRFLVNRSRDTIAEWIAEGIRLDRSA